MHFSLCWGNCLVVYYVSASKSITALGRVLHTLSTVCCLLLIGKDCPCLWIVAKGNWRETWQYDLDQQKECFT